MMLLGALICTAIVIALGIAVKCTIFWIPQCAERDWGRQIAQWLSETIPVLIAIIMTRPRD